MRSEMLTEFSKQEAANNLILKSFKEFLKFS